MEIMKQGQWYALMLNRDYTNALKYVELINKINLKENDPKNNVGWFVQRLKYLFLSLKCSLEGCFKEIQGSIRNGKCDAEAEEKVVVNVAMLMLLEGKKMSFLKPYEAIASVVEKVRNGKSMVIRMACQALDDQFNQNSIRKAIGACQDYDQNLIKNQNKIVSDEYILSLITKAVCHSLLQEKDELTAWDRLVWLYGWTEGRQSSTFKKVNQKKREAYERINKEETLKDQKKKKELVTSKISVSELAERDSLLYLDFSQLNLDLYD